MKTKCIAAALASITLLVLPVADAAAERVKGTETCTAGNYPRTIGGKKYNCTSKCTTPFTDTTCTPSGACSSTAGTETTYKDCSPAAASIRDQIRIPQGGLLEVSPESGGGRPSSTGQPVRPAAPAAPMLR